MDDKQKGVAPTIENEDLNTTAPNPRSSDWKMAAPVFRQTSGKLPQGFEKKYGVIDDAPESDPADSPTDEASAASSPDAQAEPTLKTPVLRIVLVLLGIGAMTAFLVVFLTLVYFLFFRWE